MKKISVIIPIYNSEKYIPRCLDSICGQTYKNIEIVCIDDGSSDKTCKMLVDYIEKYHLDGWKPIFNSPNKGWKKNFRDGIQLAKNDLIFPCDQDDIWEKDNPFGITAFGDILAVDNEGYIIMYKLLDAEKNVICANAELFFKLINDKEYQADYFALDEYEYAKKNIGILEKDECYTYEPIPALGGNKSRNTISKGKKVEYLSILTSFL